MKNLSANQTPVRSSRARLLVFLLIPAFLCASGVVVFFLRAQSATALAAETKSAAVQPVTIEHAALSDPKQELVLPAMLQAYNESPVYARVNGYVSHWYSNIGDHVHRGQLMAVIDSPQVDQQLLQARAALNQAKASLTLANTTTKRYLDLIGSNSVSQQEVDQNVQNQTFQNASVRSATAQLAWLQQEQAYEKIVAPFDGVVTVRNTDIGDLINAGNGGTGSQLYSVARISTMRVFVSVPEAYSAQIANGMKVSLELTALPGRKFEGSVTRNDDAINMSSRTMLVEVDVPNPHGELMPGAYAQVHFVLHSAVRPLVVPSGDILFQAPGPQIAVVEKGRIQLRNVVLGKDLGTSMEVTSGITPQDQIVANPPDDLVDGMQASIQSETPASK